MNINYQIVSIEQTLNFWEDIFTLSYFQMFHDVAMVLIIVLLFSILTYHTSIQVVIVTMIDLYTGSWRFIW